MSAASSGSDDEVLAEGRCAVGALQLRRPAPLRDDAMHALLNLVRCAETQYAVAT